jgi:hypothetical protein
MSVSMSNKPFRCWIYFSPLIFGYLLFSFDPLPPFKRRGCCWLMGLTCQPVSDVENWDHNQLFMYQ